MQNDNNIYLQLIQQTIYTIHYYFLPPLLPPSLLPPFPSPSPSGPSVPYGLVALRALEAVRRGASRC